MNKLVVPVLVLFTTSKLSSSSVLVVVPMPSMPTKPTLTVTFCVPDTLTVLTLAAPLRSTTVAAALPETLTVMLLALVDVKVEAMALAEVVSMPSPVANVTVLAALAVMKASSVAVTLTEVATLAVTVA